MFLGKHFICVLIYNDNVQLKSEYCLKKNIICNYQAFINMNKWDFK